MFVATRSITVTGNALNLQSYALTPAGDTTVTFLLIKNGNTSLPVGQVSFLVGSNTPSNTTVSANTFTLAVGDRLEIVSPSTIETNISDVAISVIGCSNMGTCPA